MQLQMIEWVWIVAVDQLERNQESVQGVPGAIERLSREGSILRSCGGKEGDPVSYQNFAETPSHN